MNRLIDWLAERSVALDARPRKRRAKDKGFILISMLVLFVAVSGSVAAILSAAQATISNSTMSREFIQAGQLTDRAVQDALFQLNQNSNYAVNATGTDFANSATPKVSTGASNGGTWRWSMSFVTTPGGWPQLQISADGTFSKTTRHATTAASALAVGSFTVSPDNQLSYEVSPQSAFQHVLFGKNLTVTNGAGVGGGSAFVTGNVGITGSTAVFNTTSGSTAANNGIYRLYGTAAASTSIPDIPSSSVKKAPLGLHLDKTFIADNIARCGGASAEAWVASKNGGKLSATTGKDGNTGCYSSMVFDVPTIVDGTGTFNAFVSGGVTFNQNVSMAPFTALNIYSNGNVDFNVEVAPTSMNISNTFIYAPQGTCKTNPNPSASKSLTFTGSLACDTINVAGKFTTTPAINPLGSEVYASSIWYLTDYQQPSGSRG